MLFVKLMDIIALAIVIACMHNKSTKSHWRIVPEAIKIAITAWPIVFAAVVAQGTSSLTLSLEKLALI
jgi:hypothetical protein